MTGDSEGGGWAATPKVGMVGEGRLGRAPGKPPGRPPGPALGAIGCGSGASAVMGLMYGLGGHAVAATRACCWKNTTVIASS